LVKGPLAQKSLALRRGFLPATAARGYTSPASSRAMIAFNRGKKVNPALGSG